MKLAKTEDASDRISREDYIKSLVDSLDKLLGEGAVAKDIVDISSNIRFWLSSRSYILDKVLGGGYPAGRLIEISGGEGVGKTTLVLCAIAEVQEQGGVGILLDKENSFDSFYARRCGVKLNSQFIYIGPEKCNKTEKALVVAREIARNADKNLPQLLAIDSIAAFPAASDLGMEVKDIEEHKQAMAGVARAISFSVREITELLSRTQTVWICINQLRDTLSRLGAKEEAPGGRALKFFASVRLELKKEGNALRQIDGRKYVEGIYTRARNIKSKVGMPFRDCSLRFDFDGGINNEDTAFDWLFKNKLLGEDSVGWYSWGDKKYRRKDLCELWKTDEEAWTVAKTLVDVNFK